MLSLWFTNTNWMSFIFSKREASGEQRNNLLKFVQIHSNNQILFKKKTIRTTRSPTLYSELPTSTTSSEFTLLRTKQRHTPQALTPPKSAGKSVGKRTNFPAEITQECQIYFYSKELGRVILRYARRIVNWLAGGLPRPWPNHQRR